ncbi:MAG: hypothetical protein ACI9DQ_001446 [Glaciecola sp.]|jgi:hypothetical protein
MLKYTFQLDRHDLYLSQAGSVNSNVLYFKQSASQDEYCDQRDQKRSHRTA